MIQAEQISTSELEEHAAALGVALPIEQTAAWARYQATIAGREPWGCVALKEGEHTLAVASLFDYATHGYHYLRTNHAPLWADAPSAAQESAALEALAAYVRSRDHRQVFIRLSVLADLPACRPTLSGIPYDQTVVIDVTGGADKILERMKPRGRRDVRKALRESPVTCADETTQATTSFEEYYDVMRETGARDGFCPSPCTDYEDMIRILGREHCRVYAGRLDGRVVTWSIVTISGTRATRYYAASRNDTMRQHVSDKLVYFECQDLGERGVCDYDLMGIGSDFSPKLKGLNEFKTKFSKQVCTVAPDRDLPVRHGLYTTLTAVKRLRSRS